MTNLVANMSGFVTEEERTRTLEYLASRSAPAEGRL